MNIILMFVCSSKMIFSIDNNVIKDMKVIGVCPGNLLGIKKLCINKNIDIALEEYKEKNKH